MLEDNPEVAFSLLMTESSPSPAVPETPPSTPVPLPSTSPAHLEGYMDSEDGDSSGSSTDDMDIGA